MTNDFGEMMMTLLSIVGDDTSRIVPVLYLYKTMMENHILLCDDDEANFARAKNLKKGMQSFSKQENLGWDIKVVSVNEDSASQIESVTKEHCKKEEEIWLNATDGYPSMTILLSNLLRRRGGKTISYDHFDNDLHIIEADGSMKTIVMPSSMNLKSYLTLLNFKIIKKPNKESLESRETYILKLYEDEPSYIKVKDALVKQMHDARYRFDFSSHAHTLEILKTLNIVNKNHRLIRSQQKALQGDILEEYLYWLCLPLNADDTMVSVQVDFEGRDKGDTLPKVFNEFDVLMIHNNRICAIECKLSNGLKGLDVVYKYDAIIDYFGAASKAIIANVSSRDKEPYLDMNASYNFSHSTLRRAKMSSISIYHEKYIDVDKFQNLVKDFFNIT